MIPAIQDSDALVSAALGNGDSFTKTITSLSEIVVPSEQSIQKSDIEVKVQADNAIEVNPNSDSKHARSFTDSKPPDENPDPIPKDAVRPAEEININGHPTEINNSNTHLESMSSSRADVPDGTPEPPANSSVSLPSTQITDNNASEPLDEKTKKSMERAGSGGKRTAKKVVRQKRWKC
ncbi:uncharacterized protein LOC110024612 [Phalaenopsis equestris]|uniref:uncharacterized protein LOC110024612 n=1 Tax=Phalaenopsis equestris TaxID=78828 RepID=UPI0009E61B89|nr:uncharacterized protein LOC110024612 [Phalaenopsis equestris]